MHAPVHGLALGDALPPDPQSTRDQRNPDLTSDVAEGVLEVGHWDGGDGAARPPPAFFSFAAALDGRAARSGLPALSLG